MTDYKVFDTNATWTELEARLGAVLMNDVFIPIIPNGRLREAPDYKIILVNSKWYAVSACDWEWIYVKGVKNGKEI